MKWTGVITMNVEVVTIKLLHSMISLFVVPGNFSRDPKRGSILLFQCNLLLVLLSKTSSFFDPFFTFFVRPFELGNHSETNGMEYDVLERPRFEHPFIPTSHLHTGTERGVLLPHPEVKVRRHLGGTNRGRQGRSIDLVTLLTAEVGVHPVLPRLFPCLSSCDTISSAQRPSYHHHYCHNW